MPQLTEAATAPPTTNDQRPHSATTSQALINAAAEVRANPGAVTPVRAKALGIVADAAGRYDELREPAQTLRDALAQLDDKPLPPKVASALASIAKYRTADDTDEVAAFWDTVEEQVKTTGDPDAVFARVYHVLDVEQAKLAEVERIAASLGATIVEVDPAAKPDSLKGTTVHGWYDAEPTPRLIFPADAKPGERLHAAREIHRDLVSQ